MKILARNTTRKRIALGGVAIFILLLGVAALAYHFQTWPFHVQKNPSSLNLAPATSDQIKAGEETKKATVEGSATKQSTSGSDQPPAPTLQPDGAKSQVEVTITAANQNSSTLQIRTLISAVVNDGTCTLLLTGPSGQTVSHTSTVQPLSSTSTCKGFDVPNSDLSSGTWNLKLQYDNNSLTGSVSKNITIK